MLNFLFTFSKFSILQKKQNLFHSSLQQKFILQYFFLVCSITKTYVKNMYNIETFISHRVYKNHFYFLISHGKSQFKQKTRHYTNKKQTTPLITTWFLYKSMHKKGKPTSSVAEQSKTTTGLIQNLHPLKRLKLLLPL